MNARMGIRVEGLKKRLRANQALGGISAAFDPGFLHGVIGPDGAGKTTLLRHLIGLLTADEGRITFHQDGHEVPFGTVRPHMAYMPQRQSLYPDLSVGEHLDFFRDLFQLPGAAYRTRREALLGMTRLGPFVDRPAGHLSGGMYKKLGLMCALLPSPAVVLLDEPTNGVDPISRREFWELLYRLVGSGILVVMATSYMDEAERCGRVHIMEEGVLLAEGDPREVLAREGVSSFEELFLRRAAAGASR